MMPDFRVQGSGFRVQGFNSVLFCGSAFAEEYLGFFYSLYFRTFTFCMEKVLRKWRLLAYQDD
jgi:hypothetical protein